ncbi:hypothetical protein D3C87_1354430 [compost metagenome]
MNAEKAWVENVCSSTLSLSRYARGRTVSNTRANLILLCLEKRPTVCFDFVSVSVDLRSRAHTSASVTSGVLAL